MDLGRLLARREAAVIWSPQQDAALKKVAAWLRDSKGAQVFRLFGYAGTGKTTLARYAAADAASVGWSVRFAAYTGKAASRLREKGCDGATTIHELAYELVGTTKAKQRVIAHDGKARVVDVERPKFQAVGSTESLFGEQALVVLDECSMVGDFMGRDLLALGCRFLVLGDPFQLPPIEGAGFFERVTPDVVLTEVHRTALDSPVLRLATHVRTSGLIAPLDWGDCKVVRCKRWSELPWEAHEQVIVGRNATRHAFNRAAHKRVSNDPLPVEGERLICLRNQKRIGLMNGELGTVMQRLTQLDDEDVFGLTLERDGGKLLRLDAWRSPFITGELPRFVSGPQPTVLDYGTAITCHKAQGSEWESVLVCDESSAFREDARRWLYTAATRAQRQLTVGIA